MTRQRRLAKWCLLVTVAALGCDALTIETDVRRKCDLHKNAAKRGQFIIDCLQAWNPGEEDWGRTLGQKCERLADANWPTPRTCGSWVVELRYSGEWVSCDVQTHPDAIEQCYAAGWESPE